MKKPIFKLIGPKPNPEVIDLLEEFLEMAKKGKISSIAIAGLLSDGKSIESTSDTRNFQALVGSVSILQHKMLNNIVEIP